MDLGIVFSDPFFSGESGIQSSIFNLAGHFLGAAYRTFNQIIINLREITATVDTDIPSGAFEQGDRRLLKAPFGDAQL